MSFVCLQPVNLPAYAWQDGLRFGRSRRVVMASTGDSCLRHQHRIGTVVLARMCNAHFSEVRRMKSWRLGAFPTARGMTIDSGRLHFYCTEPQAGHAR